MEERQVTVDFRWGDYLVIIQDVPAKVCNECGERYYTAEVVRQMERIAKEGQRDKEIQVPVVALGKSEGARINADELRFRSVVFRVYPYPVNFWWSWRKIT
ncbi:MAG TPA: type II toxin-antitoxin system MqsA family antitoxin [Blastocatellia bacterium]|nr:type II toxin-antitoxin system MqsA family antitoxin [Blastocatellia bacterium]